MGQMAAGNSIEDLTWNSQMDPKKRFPSEDRNMRLMADIKTPSKTRQESSREKPKQGRDNLIKAVSNRLPKGRLLMLTQSRDLR